MCGVSVRIYEPCVALRGYVTFFYFVEAAAPLEDFLYPEWGNIRFATSGTWMVRMPGYSDESPQTAVLFGPTDRHGAIRTSGGSTVGFGLTPIGWDRLIGGSAAEMANRVRPLGTLLGVEGEAIRHSITGVRDDVAVRYLEALLSEVLSNRPSVISVVLAADKALRTRPASLEVFADRTGVSTRTLHRICRRSFGFAPKRLMRLQRFLDTLGQVRTAMGSPVQSALDDEYFDQSHFYKDFRDFMAMTPRQYFGAPRPLMAAAAEAQARAGVTLSFRLPPQPSE